MATVIDCFNKEVIGYAMAEHMRTELICDALDMAARNHLLEPDAIMHSDYAEVCVKPRICGDGLLSWELLVDFSA
jgi:hypothetical protein